MSFNIMNMNQETGYRFGYISAQNIDSEMLDKLIYTVGTDISYKSALYEADREHERNLQAHISEMLEQDPEADEAELAAAFGEFDSEKFSDDYQCDEPIVEGEYEGVKYRTSWLGGAFNLWVFQSPVLWKCRECSLCVPGAANLDQAGEGDYTGYGLPVDWLDERFIEDRVKAIGYEMGSPRELFIEHVEVKND